MKTNLLATCIAVIGMLIAACPAGAANYGKYISWTIEEFDGRRWTELSARPSDQQSHENCELSNMWSQYGSCGGSYRRDGGGSISDVDNFVSQSFRIKPTMGRKYRLRVTNLTQCRLAVTVDIDGKNNIDSSNVTATSGDASWVLERNKTIQIKGFQSGSSTAMEFYWTEPDDAHSDREEKLGAIKMYTYFEDSECAREALISHCESQPEVGRSLAKRSPGATGAGDEVSNPVRTVNFDSLTRNPLEEIKIIYDDRYSDRDSYDSTRYSCEPDNHYPDNHYPDNRYPDNRYPDTNHNDSSSCFTGIGVRMSDTSYTGVVVTDVFRNSPAWKAGVRNGDKIIKVDGRNVNKPDQLSKLLKRMSIGEYVVIKYVHNGKATTAGVSLDTICER